MIKNPPNNSGVRNQVVLIDHEEKLYVLLIMYYKMYWG